MRENWFAHFWDFTQHTQLNVTVSQLTTVALHRYYIINVNHKCAWQTSLPVSHLFDASETPSVRAFFFFYINRKGDFFIKSAMKCSSFKDLYLVTKRDQDHVIFGQVKYLITKWNKIYILIWFCILQRTSKSFKYKSSLFSVILCCQCNTCQVWYVFWRMALFSLQYVWICNIYLF